MSIPGPNKTPINKLSTYCFRVSTVYNRVYRNSSSMFKHSGWDKVKGGFDWMSMTDISNFYNSRQRRRSEFLNDKLESNTSPIKWKFKSYFHLVSWRKKAVLLTISRYITHLLCFLLHCWTDPEEKVRQYYWWCVKGTLNINMWKYDSINQTCYIYWDYFNGVLGRNGLISFSHLSNYRNRIGSIIFHDYCTWFWNGCVNYFAQRYLYYHYITIP